MHSLQVMAQQLLFDIVAVAMLMFMQCRCRVWFELVDSESNVSDGLSRAGVADPWTLSQGWILHEVPKKCFALRAESLSDWKWQII